MTARGVRARGRATRTRVAFVVAAAVTVAPLVPAAGAAANPTTGRTAAATVVAFSGHGWGHGRGMGQYGALGYALEQGWSYHQILDHYYGGTVPGQAPTGTVMTVDMTAEDGQDTIVVQSAGRMQVAAAPGFACTAGSPCAVRISRTGPATWTVYNGSACSGGPAGWKVASTAVAAPSIAVVASAGASDNPADMLGLCQTDGTRWLRGDIWAVDTGSTQATVNHVPLESYVRGVVPNESPASWGALGGGLGQQELLAQAVASRSYAMAANRSAYAKTCDSTSCQIYGGRAFQGNDGVFRDLEGTAVFSASDQAVAATAGEVRVFGTGGGGPAGAIAPTEFSSSTGGYTAGGVFPAVVDDGDATASNPNHTWTDTVATSDIESAYGTGLGNLVSVNVTGRNALGDLGGRVTSLTMHFAGGDVTATGSGFAGTVGLRSDWFTVTAQPAPSTTPSPSPPPPATIGYHVLTADGSVFGFAGAPTFGSLAASAARTTAVGLGEIPGGYWILGANGGVYDFGTAASHGSLRTLALNAPPFQLWPTPTAGGYWIVAHDGGVFAFGDAAFFGSTGNLRLNKPVVGMAPTPDGRGYWLVASDGGIFSFGDAVFYGSTGNLRLNKPVVAMAATPTGRGYTLLASDGGIFEFGDATFEGSLPGMRVTERAVSMAVGSGGGYVIATEPGHVYGFGTTAAGGPANVAWVPAPTVSVAFAR